MRKSPITLWLEKTNPAFFSIYAIIAAFCTYACMYAFRKAFQGTEYDAYSLWGMDYKTLLVLTQTIGYALSKFIGIKVISEMGGDKRAKAIVLLIGIAWIALLLFAVVPYPFNFVCLFFNGLPLGMIWGLVFSYLEGRKFTELLGAGLSISFVVSSGFVKSVGNALVVNFGVPEFWMPFAVGAIFFPPLLLFVYLLNNLPPPNAEDVKLRTERKPMNGAERRQFFRKFAPGLIVLTLIYMLLTAYRDFRDSFNSDIWKDLGVQKPALLALTELPIALVVGIVITITLTIKDNKKALFVNHVLVMIGIATVGLSTLAHELWLADYGETGHFIWMVLIGLGGYLAYIPFNVNFFDRLIAAFKEPSNVGFLIYVADAFGYLASVGIMLYKDFGAGEMNRFEFVSKSGYVMAIVGVVLTFIAMLYFRKKEA